MLCNQKLGFLYADEDDNKIIQVINQFDSFGNLIHSKIINECEIVLFALTNRFCESENFIKNHEAAKKGKKIIFYMLLEKINFAGLNNLNAFDFSGLVHLTYQESAKNRLENVLSRALQIKRDYQSINFEWITTKFKNNSVIIVKQHHMLNEEVIINHNEYHNFKISVYNLKTGDLISTCSNFVDFFCWLSFLNSFICMNRMYNNTQPFITIFDNKGSLVNRVEILNKMDVFVVRSILCNEEKEEFYLHGFEYSLGETIWIFDKKIQVIKIIENYSIYDLASKYSNVIEFRNLQYSVFYNSMKFCALQILHVSNHHEILIFELNSYSIVGSIKTSYRLEVFFNNKIILRDDKNKIYLIYKINFSKRETLSISNSIDTKFICKSSQYLKSPHLYSNPYLLPCGNSVCFDCIHLNYNLYKNTFKCSFENCKVEHILTKQLEKHDDLVNLINMNCKKLFEPLIETKILILNNLGETIC